MPNVQPSRLTNENVKRVTSDDQKGNSCPLAQKNQPKPDDEREKSDKWSVCPKPMLRGGIDQQEYSEKSFEDEKHASDAEQNYLRHL